MHILRNRAHGKKYSLTANLLSRDLTLVMMGDFRSYKNKDEG